MVGLVIFATSVQDSNRFLVYTSMYSRVAISLMSAPAAKAFSLPVMTMAPTVSSSSKARAAWMTSFSRPSHSALSALGRCNVMSPAAPFFSAFMNSYSLLRPEDMQRMAGGAIRAEAPLRAKQLLLSSSLDILVKANGR